MYLIWIVYIYTNSFFFSFLFAFFLCCTHNYTYTWNWSLKSFDILLATNNDHYLTCHQIEIVARNEMKLLWFMKIDLWMLFFVDCVVQQTDSRFVWFSCANFFQLICQYVSIGLFFCCCCMKLNAIAYFDGNIYWSSICNCLSTHFNSTKLLMMLIFYTENLFCFYESTEAISTSDKNVCENTFAIKVLLLCLHYYHSRDFETE